jgi:uncharacterized protein DUF4232
MPSPSPAVLPLALVAGAMVLTAAACGQNGGQAPAPTSPTPTAASAATSSAASTTSTTSTAATATPTAGTGTPTNEAGGDRCTVGSLRIRYADDVGSAGAGSVSGTFTFTNTGSTSCTLAGFPGVSYVGAGGGTQVGQAATRTGDPVKVRTLAPGKSVKAALRRTQPGNYGDACQETKVDGFRVYPPDSTESAVVSFPTTGCKSTSAPLLQVGPVR